MKINEKNIRIEKTNPPFQSNQGLQHNGYRYLREKEKARKREERSK